MLVSASITSKGAGRGSVGPIISCSWTPRSGIVLTSLWQRNKQAMANLSVRRKIIWSHSVVDIAHAPELLGIGYVAGGDVIETFALRDDVLGQDDRIRARRQEAAADVGHCSTFSSLK